MTPFADHAETHISVVFFAGDRAYKILKPIRTSFLDYSTRALRLEAVDREVRLNRRIAPDVYLGTADVIERGAVVDRFVVMERMPAERRLTTLLGQPDWENHVRRIARSIAQFHGAQPPLHDARATQAIESVRGNWDDNHAAMAQWEGLVLDLGDVDEVRRLSAEYLDGRGRLLQQRAAAGLIRDGHGDLTAEDIFCLDNGPQILDCLAFRDDLRIGDVLLDLAFLAMDLERLAGAPVADVLMAAYQEFSNEHHPSSLAHHFIAYRAHVRAKVSCIRFSQGVDSAAELARTYHSLCLDHLRAGKVRLVLIGGGPGTGKTTLADRLSSRFGWISLNSDELRKDLTGHSHGEQVSAPFGEGIYVPEVTEETYRVLLQRAGLLLEQGESVILDATWRDEPHRAMARDLARRLGAELSELECVLDPDEAKHRITARAQGPRTDSSDATVAIVDRAFAERDPWPSASTIDTADPPESALVEASKVCLGSAYELMTHSFRDREAHHGSQLT